MTASTSNKVALVTGSSRGIGATTAQYLADKGWDVIINYVSSAKPAEELVDKINAAKKTRAVAIKADMSTLEGPTQLARDAVKAFGRLDAVIHTAGVMPRGAGMDFDAKAFDAVIHTNCRAPLLLTQALTPELEKTKGVVILISSGLTKLSGVPPTELLYISSKGFIEQATRVLAKGLGAKGIRVLCVAPGPTDTAMFTDPKTPEQIKFFESLSPFNRLGKPEEIAKMIGFAVSDDASWCSGAVYFVHGANQV